MNFILSINPIPNTNSSTLSDLTTLISTLLPLQATFLSETSKSTAALKYSLSCRAVATSLLQISLVIDAPSNEKVYTVTYSVAQPIKMRTSDQDYVLTPFNISGPFTNPNYLSETDNSTIANGKNYQELTSMGLKGDAALAVYNLMNMDPLVFGKFSQVIRIFNRMYYLNINFGSRLGLFLKTIAESSTTARERLTVEYMKESSLGTRGRLTSQRVVHELPKEVVIKVGVYYSLWILRVAAYCFKFFRIRFGGVVLFVVLHYLPTLSLIVLNMVYIDFAFYGLHVLFHFNNLLSKLGFLVLLTLMTMDFLSLISLLMDNSNMRVFYKKILRPVLARRAELLLEDQLKKQRKGSKVPTTTADKYLDEGASLKARTSDKESIQSTAQGSIDKNERCSPEELQTLNKKQHDEELDEMKVTNFTTPASMRLMTDDIMISEKKILVVKKMDKSADGKLGRRTSKEDVIGGNEKKEKTKKTIDYVKSYRNIEMKSLIMNTLTDSIRVTEETIHLVGARFFLLANMVRLVSYQLMFVSTQTSTAPALSVLLIVEITRIVLAVYYEIKYKIFNIKCIFFIDMFQSSLCIIFTSICLGLCYSSQPNSSVGDGMQIVGMVIVGVFGVMEYINLLIRIGYLIWKYLERRRLKLRRPFLWYILYS